MSAAAPPQRIALISSQAFSIVNFRASLIRAWIAGGAQVFALAPDYTPALRARVAALGAEPLDYPMSRNGIRPLGDLFALFALWRRLRRLRADTSFAYFIKPVIYGSLAARLAGVPARYAMVEGAGYVFGEHGADGWKRRLLRQAVCRLYRIGLGCARRVFFLNRDDLAQFVGEGLVEARKVVLSGAIGVDLQEYAAQPLPPGPPHFIMVARLLAEKGVREFAAAAELVRRRHPECRFTLLGGLDPNPAGLGEAEVRRWVERGILEWPGQVEDVRPWLVRASVFVLPSYYREGVPRSTQEAMALGRPVITTDSPGCRDTVRHGENGFLVAPRDVAALAEAMARCAGEPARLAAMGARSRELAEALFDARRQDAGLLAAMGCTGGAG